MLETLLISCAAGVIGTGTGGVIGLLLGESSKRSMSYLLSFASGVMVSIVCFDLIPESLELASLSTVVVSIILGAVIVQFLNALHRPALPHPRNSCGIGGAPPPGGDPQPPAEAVDADVRPCDVCRHLAAQPAGGDGHWLWGQP